MSKCCIQFLHIKFYNLKILKQSCELSVNVCKTALLFRRGGARKIGIRIASTVNTGIRNIIEAGGSTNIYQSYLTI